MSCGGRRRGHLEAGCLGWRWRAYGLVGAASHGRRLRVRHHLLVSLRLQLLNQLFAGLLRIIILLLLRRVGGGAGGVCCFEHPGVCPDLLSCRSLAAVVAEDAQDEVLERRRQVVTVNLREVRVQTPTENQAVEVLFLPSLLEGEDTLHYDEQDDTQAENVHLASVVGFAFLDFGRHVCHGPPVRLQRIDGLVAREAEICDFQVELRVDQNVLQFEVAVHHSHLVHVVDGVEQLRDKEAASVLPHRTHRLTEVKEEPTGDILHGDVDKVADAAARRFDDLAAVAEALHGHDVHVVHVLEDCDLIVH